MSDTPETDKLIRTYHTVIGTDAIGLASKLTLKCMELERERNEAFALLASEKSTRNHIVQRAAETERERDLWKAEVERWKTTSQTQTIQNNAYTN